MATLCTAICLQKVTNTTRGSRVALCSPGQAGHTVAVLTDQWRLIGGRLECDVMTPFNHQCVSFSLFVFISLGVFPPCFCPCASRLSGKQEDWVVVVAKGALQGGVGFNMPDGGCGVSASHQLSNFLVVLTQI